MKTGGGEIRGDLRPGLSEWAFSHSVIKYNEGGIFEIHCIDEYVFEIEDVKEVHALLEKCSRELGRKVAVVSYSKSLNNVDLETMKFVGKGPHAGFVRAEAFVISSLPQRLMANFFMNRMRRKVPARVFTEKNKALNWLIEFSNK